MTSAPCVFLSFVLAITLLLGAGQGAVANPGTSETQPQSGLAQSAPWLTIERYSGVVDAQTPLSLTLGVQTRTALRDPRITLALREPLNDRTDMVSSVLEEQVGWLFSSSVERLDPMDANQHLQVPITRTLSSLYLDRYDAKGVYPLEITLVDGNKPIERLVTTLLVSPEVTPVSVGVLGGLGQTQHSVVVGAHDDVPTQASEVIATPAFDADLLGLTQTGQGDLAQQLIVEGVRDVQSATDRAALSVLAVPGPIDRVTASVIRGVEGLDGMVLPPASLVGDRSIYRYGQQRVFSMDPRIIQAARALDGVALGQWLHTFAFLPEEEGKAVIPFIVDVRFIPDPKDQSTVVQALSELSWIHIVGLSDLVTIPKGEVPEAVFASPSVSPARRNVLEDIKKERDRLPALEAMVGERAFEDGSDINALERALLEDTSLHPEIPINSNKIQSLYQEITDGVEVLLSPPVTMTGDVGTVPITVINQSTTTVDVRVDLISTNLVFPEQDQFTMRLRPRDATTKNVPVSPRTPGGLSSMIIEVKNPLTQDPIASGTLSVRSTAYPITAIIFALGAASVLGYWAWRNRPKRRHPHRQSLKEPA